MTAMLPIDTPARQELRAWTGAATAVLIVHLGVVFGYSVYDRSLALQGDAEAPPIIIDLAPLTVAPTVHPQDAAPAPELPPPPLPVEEPKPPEKPDQAKIESLSADNSPAALPQPAHQNEPEEKSKPRPSPQPVTAMPKAEHIAPTTAMARIGNSTATAAPPLWISQLLAHLNRYKQYPNIARARRQEGVVTLSFTMERDGRVLTRKIEKSSGSPILDEEALAMLQRSEPLPAFPPAMVGESRSFSVPIRFSLR